MGDPGKGGELSEAEEEEFSGKRSEALGAFSEGEWQKAIDLVSKIKKKRRHDSTGLLNLQAQQIYEKEL